MTSTQQFLVLIPLAYALGSVPFGLIVGLAKGVDPRKAGSGNIGATNVGRLLGGRFFALVFTLDLLKGFFPMLAGADILHGDAHGAGDYFLWLLVGFATVMGHNYSVFLKFNGGKGVATSCGVALGLFPYFTYPALLAAATFILAFRLSRYVSLSSIVAAISYPLFYIGFGLHYDWGVFGKQLPLLIFAALISAMIVYKHRSNLSRLLAGTENKFVKK